MQLFYTRHSVPAHGTIPQVNNLHLQVSSLIALCSRLPNSQVENPPEMPEGWEQPGAITSWCVALLHTPQKSDAIAQLACYLPLGNDVYMLDSAAWCLHLRQQHIVTAWQQPAVLGPSCSLMGLRQS